MANPIVHFDIKGRDLQSVSEFYQELLGWKVTARGPGYSQIETGGSGLNGAIEEAEEPGINLGVQVDDLDRAMAVVSSLGGEIVMPPTDNGWVVKAQVRDPAGNLISLIQADKQVETEIANGG